MASISSAGIGSGLDVNGIISKLMQVESQPLAALTKQEASYQAKLSAFGTLQGTLASLQTTVQTLKSSSTYTAKKATVSDSTVATASTTNSATSASHDISVSKLAKAHVLRTNIDYGSDTFDSGTLSITIGSGSTIGVALASVGSLADVRDAINDADAGVKASIVNDGTADRLVLTSSTTGSAGAISISVSSSNNDGERRLADLVDTNLTAAQDAQDAEFTVDGIALVRSSNTVTDAITGVTLNLLKGDAATPPTTKLTIADNTEAVTTAVANFVTAYNEVITQLKSATTYDAAAGKASVLTGDSTARSIRTQLVNAIQSKVTGLSSGVGRLSDIGIHLQSDGSLAVDESTLSSALSDPENDVSTLFRQETTGNEGIASRLDAILDGLIGTEGLVSSRTDGISANIKSVQQRSESMARRLEQIEQRYRAQFSALDALLAGMQRTSQYLTQQLANLPSTSTQ